MLAQKGAVDTLRWLKKEPQKKRVQQQQQKEPSTGKEGHQTAAVVNTFAAHVHRHKISMLNSITV